MKLYFAPRTRSTRARWLLEELGVAYELVKLDLSKQENETPAFRAVSPLGEVPALVDGDVTLFDPSAICLYLADRSPEKQLAPPPGSPERGAYYQWLLFAEGPLDAAVMAFHRHAQLPEAQRSSAQLQEALTAQRARLHEVLDVVDAALGERDVLVGDHLTAVDVSMASILHLAHHLGLLEKHPRLVEYVRRHTQRPAVRRAVSA